MKYLNLFILIGFFSFSMSGQTVDIGVTASFTPSQIEIGDPSTLTVLIQQNSFNTIPDSAVQFVVSFPISGEYIPVGVPYGPDIDRYSWNYDAGSNAWFGLNDSAYVSITTHTIYFDVMGESLTSTSGLLTDIQASINPIECPTCNEPNDINNRSTPLLVVPVEYEYMTAKSNDCESISVLWGTSFEVNNKGWHIQRSLDGEEYETIAWQDGGGTLNRPLSYSFNDEDIDPLVKKYFYRMIQEDIDGSKYYTDIITVNLDCQELSKTSIFPNPATNFIQYTLSEQYLDGELDIEIYSSSSALVFKKHIDNVGVLTDDILVDDFAPGMYTLKFITETSTENHKLIKID